MPLLIKKLAIIGIRGEGRGRLLTGGGGYRKGKERTTRNENKTSSNPNSLRPNPDRKVATSTRRAPLHLPATANVELRWNHPGSPLAQAKYEFRHPKYEFTHHKYKIKHPTSVQTPKVQQMSSDTQSISSDTQSTAL